MRVIGPLLLAVFGLTLGPAVLFAASFPQSQIKRPKVKVSFDRTSLTVSYGQTVEFCMKVVTTSPFLPKIKFGSTPAGALEGKVGGSATCADSSFTSVQVKASTSACIVSANLLAKVNDKTVATLPAIVVLPTADVAAFFRNHTCAEAGATPPGGFTEWTITFSGSAPATFDGLTVNESFTPVAPGPSDPVSCGITTPTPGPGPIGESGHNQAIDTLGTCDQTHLVECQSAFLQSVTIGACPVQTNKIFFVFSGGNFFTKRADPSTATPIPSPPIPQ